MSDVKFPALRGDSPLPILAAIGTICLIHNHVDEEAGLFWDPADLCPILRSPLSSADHVAEQLIEIVDGMPEDVIVPGAPSKFPRGREGTSGPDPMIKASDKSDLRAWNEPVWGEISASQRSVALRWLAGLVTDLTKDAKGNWPTTQFAAHRRQQTLESMLRLSLQSVKENPAYLREALMGWRRVVGVTGEWLDHRAIQLAADTGSGKSQPRGVPGATWLAVMSYELWHTTLRGNRTHTSCWHWGGKGQSDPEVLLPLWRSPLGPSAIKALIEHPALDTPKLEQGTLDLLGVFRVCRARRIKTAPGKNADSVLAPTL